MTLRIKFNNLDRQYRDLRAEILEATDTVLRSGQLMSGNNTIEFEHWLAKRNHSRYAVTCHSGTQALEILAEYFRTHHVGDQPTVAIPTLTYAATANAFARAGWDIVFIDTDRYGVMDVSQINTERLPNAIVMVGLYGRALDAPFGYSKWQDRLRLQDMVIIEDGAQHWLSDNCTRFGLATIISFDPTKNLNNYGNGGAIVTNDSDTYHWARQWRDNGKSQHDIFGSNSRMSEIDCAQLLIKASHLDDWQNRRKDIALHWIEQFRGKNLRCLIDSSNFDSHCYHKFVIEIDDRDHVQQQLINRGIETKVHYHQPLHEVGSFRQYAAPDFMCRASALARRVLSLPIYPELTDLEVEYITDQVLDCVSSKHN